MDIQTLVHKELFGAQTKNVDEESIIPRVPEHLWKVSPESYSPQLMCLGLYSKDKQSTPQAVKCRYEISRAYVELTGITTNSWYQFCTVVVGDLPRMNRIYVDVNPINVGEYGVGEKIKTLYMLTIDAIFLVGFILGLLTPSDSSDEQNDSTSTDDFQAVMKKPVFRCRAPEILRDLFLLNNQLPLFLLERVVSRLQNSAYHLEIDLSQVVKMLIHPVLLSLPGDLLETMNNNPFDFRNCKHILECLYTVLCHHTPPANPTPPIFSLSLGRYTLKLDQADTSPIPTHHPSTKPELKTSAKSNQIPSPQRVSSGGSDSDKPADSTDNPQTSISGSFSVSSTFTSLEDTQISIPSNPSGSKAHSSSPSRWVVPTFSTTPIKWSEAPLFPDTSPLNLQSCAPNPWQVPSLPMTRNPFIQSSDVSVFSNSNGSNVHSSTSSRSVFPDLPATCGPSTQSTPQQPPLFGSVPNVTNQSATDTGLAFGSAPKVTTQYGRTTLSSTESEGFQKYPTIQFLSAPMVQPFQLPPVSGFGTHSQFCSPAPSVTGAKFGQEKLHDLPARKPSLPPTARVGAQELVQSSAPLVSTDNHPTLPPSSSSSIPIPTKHSLPSKSKPNNTKIVVDKRHGGGSTTAAMIHGSADIPTATQLKKAGIRVVGGARGIMDVEFRKGKLKLPKLSLDDSTEMFLRNLATYEYVMKPVPHLLSYLRLMDCLIDTDADMALLRKEGVIHYNGLGSDSAAAAMWNQILTGYSFDISPHYAQLMAAVNRHCQLWWIDKYVEFKDIYFGKPWVTVSVIVGGVLVILTFLQTFYGILGYY